MYFNVVDDDRRLRAGNYQLTHTDQISPECPGTGTADLDLYKMTSWTKISGGDGMLVPDCRNITRLELRDSLLTRRNLADLISDLPGLKEFKYASTLPPVRDVSELAIGVFLYRVHWDNIDVVDAFEGAL